jgi:hypothetical protein
MTSCSRVCDYQSSGRTWKTDGTVKRFCLCRMKGGSLSCLGLHEWRCSVSLGCCESAEISVIGFKSPDVWRELMKSYRGVAGTRIREAAV